MAVAFNPSEEVREGGPQQHLHHQHANSANSVQPEPTSSASTSASSSQSSTASSSANSSPGAVSAPMPIPQAQFAHPMYYYPAGSPLVPPHSPVPPTATVYQQRQYNNEELIQAICEALHRCSNGSMPPPSPSCSPYTPANVPLTPFAVYGQTPSANTGDTNVFFPQNMPATPHAYYTHPQHQNQSHQPPPTPISHPSYYTVPQQQPLYFQYHTVQPAYATTVTPTPTPATPSVPQTATATTTTSAFPSSTVNTPQLQIPRRAARRIRLSSRSEASPSTSQQRIPTESSESDADPVLCNDVNNYMTIVDTNNNYNNSANSSDSEHPLHDHLTYLEARERLEEFPGRVPQRRKKSMATAASSASASKKAAIVDSMHSDTDGSSPEIIPSQKQQIRQVNKTSDLSGKGSSSSAPLLSTSASHMGQQGSSSQGSNSSPARKKGIEKSKEQCLSWSLVTAFVLVVGCGFFASR